MTSKYAFENLLRSPWEWLAALVAVGFGILCIKHSNIVALDFKDAVYISMPFFIFAALRFLQGSKVYFYRKRLLKLKPFAMGITDVPISKENLFLGKGFRWLPIHRQRMHLLSVVDNQGFMQKSRLYLYVQKQADHNPKRICAKLRKIPFLPFKPSPDIGGKPWLHGVGSDLEQSVFIKQANRNSHTVVFGMTRVGKTRLASILVNQDIRNGEAVLILDPKGDLEIMQDMYCACKAAGRLGDFKVLHAGMSDISAKYNPLANYTNVSEVATRITSAIQAEGEGKQFQDFAWKFLNIVATCLEEMGEPVTYKTLSFFVTRPKQLLLAYCDKILPKKDQNYLYKIEEIIKKNSGKIDKQGNSVNFTRADAARTYVAEYIESVISKGDYTALHDSIIADLYHAAQIGEEYYGKITASLGPVFDKINKTSAGEVFSWEYNFGLPVIKLEEIIKRKQVVYIGLDP
jgi:conjugative coupling factor TraD (SXT/TOL subfamily)